MSCSRGNTARNRPQKHQNRTAFKNDLHDTSKRTKTINKLDISGVCERCKGIIEWKIKYKKYKPLTAPSKCVNCNEKTVKFAYHMLCCKCAKEKKSCAKCMKVHGVESETVSESPSLPNVEQDLKATLKQLSERKRRSLLRAIKKQSDESSSPQELQAIMEEWMERVKLEDHDELSDDDHGSSSEDN